MWLTPSRRQWAQWSLPSKLTAIGALLAVLSLCFYFVEKGYSLVATGKLEREVANLKAELAATRAALDAPKAEIECSLAEVGRNMENLGVKEAFVRPELDGTVRFTITLANKSRVQAKNGSIYLRICRGCEYAEEPLEFVKQSSEKNQDRLRYFRTLDAHTGLLIPLRIANAPGSRQFIVSVTSRCENCVFRPDEELTIRY